MSAVTHPRSTCSSYNICCCRTTSLFCHVGKEVQEFRPLAIQAASTAEVYLAVVSRPSSSRIARIAPNMTEEGSALIRREVLPVFWPWRGRAADHTHTLPYRPDGNFFYLAHL